MQRNQHHQTDAHQSSRDGTRRPRPLRPFVRHDQIGQHADPMDLPRLPLRPLLVHLGMPVLPPAHVSELHGGGGLKSGRRSRGGKIWRFGALDRINGIEGGVLFSECRVGHDHRQNVQVSCIRSPQPRQCGTLRPDRARGATAVQWRAESAGGRAQVSQPPNRRWKRRAAIRPPAVKTVLPLPLPARESTPPLSSLPAPAVCTHQALKECLSADKQQQLLPETRPAGTTTA